MQNAKIEGFQLSPQQRRIWTLHPHLGGTPYTAASTVRILGNLDVSVLRGVLERVHERHEILRTTFYASREMSMPVQVVGNTIPVVECRDLRGLDRAAQVRSVAAYREQIDGKAFDLMAGPLTRMCVIALSAGDHMLLLQTSALCCDPQGLSNLVAEIFRCYDAASRREKVGDDVLQYVDASGWLNDALSSEASVTGRQFWQESDVRSGVGQTMPFELESTDGGPFERQHVAVNLQGVNLADVASRLPGHDQSVDAVLLTCWLHLLQRTMGDARLAVGYVSDGRAYAELEDAIGIFSRCVPLPGNLPMSLPFHDAAAQVHTSLREATRWSEAFDWSLVSPALDTGGAAPYCAFAYEHRILSRRRTTSGLECIVETADACVDRFKIKLVSYQHSDDSVTAELEFDAALYREEDVRRLAEQLATLVEDAVGSPYRELGVLRILPDEQRRQVAHAVDGGSTPFPAECVHRLFEAQVIRTPQSDAVVCDDERLTYAELNVRANRLAHYLHRCGVRPDMRVAMCLERSVASIVGILGILKAGGAYVPLDPRWPASRLSSMLDECGASVLVTEAGLADGIATSALKLLLDRDAHRLASESAENPAGGAQPSDLVYVIFTSGSTGSPKGVCVEHRQLTNYVHGVLKQLDVPDRANFATVTTVAADLGNTAIYGALLSGGCLHVVTESRASDPEAFAEYVARHHIDVLKIVPSHLKALMSCSKPERILPHHRLVLGGEACPWDLVDTVRRLAAHCIVFNHYGPTETTVGATTWRIADDGRRAATGTVPIGRALPNVRTYVLDAHLRPVPLWVAGELYIGGEGVARGYLNAAGQTAARFLADPFSSEPTARMYRTGDIARILPMGVLEFLGRVDDQVKIRGFRVELGEIESTVRRYPAVRDAAVLVQQDDAGGKRPVAFVVTDNTSRDTTRLNAFLKSELPEYMVPAAITIVDALPLNSNGKVDRTELRNMLDRQPESTSSSEPPSTRWETIVAGVWCDLLQTDQVSVHDNFYDLGGHSLIAIQVVTALERRTGARISPRDLVFHTLRQFAALCESKATADRAAL